jgi:hypothetical protein
VTLRASVPDPSGLVVAVVTRVEDSAAHAVRRLAQLVGHLSVPQGCARTSRPTWLNAQPSAEAAAGLLGYPTAVRRGASALTGSLGRVEVEPHPVAGVLWQDPLPRLREL